MLISEACLLPWQRPNATEAYAAEQLTSQAMSPQGSYVAFPWASWIDIFRDNPAPQAPLAAAPVNFRKDVTPGLPLKRPSSTLTPGPVRSLPVAC